MDHKLTLEPEHQLLLLRCIASGARRHAVDELGTDIVV
jgi:hypothetical protein